MQIPITLPPALASSRTLPPQLLKLGTSLLLLELQGSLDVSGEPEEGEERIVGEFRIDGDKPTLMIGHHLLEGKIVTLPKPLAVLRRCGPAVVASAPSAEEEDDDGTGGGTSYEILEVVRKKVVFSRRPGLVGIMGKPGAGPGTGTGWMNKKG